MGRQLQRKAFLLPHVQTCVEGWGWRGECRELALAEPLATEQELLLTHGLKDAVLS